MSKVLDKILEPILDLVPDLVYYIDPREQAFSKETDKLSKCIFGQVVDRLIMLGMVGGLFLGNVIVKIVCLVLIVVMIISIIRKEKKQIKSFES